MRHALSLTALTLFALALSPGLGASQSTPPPGPQGSPTDEATRLAERLNGRWALVHGEEAAQQQVDQAIEQATSGMLPIVNGVTARELRARNPINGAFDIEITPQRIHTVFETATFTSAPGQPIRTSVPGEDEQMEVVQVIREGRLEQIFTTDRGRRWSLFVPSDDGQRLTMQVTVQSGMLPRAMRYDLEYRRAQ